MGARLGCAVYSLYTFPIGLGSVLSHRGEGFTEFTAFALLNYLGRGQNLSA